MKLFYQVARYLKTVVKAKMPIHVRRIKMRELAGSCEEKEKYFLIKIDKNLSEEHAIDVLIHEISHAEAWDMDADWHGRNWGIAYSRIYRCFSEEFLS